MSTRSFKLPNPMYYPMTETEKQGGWCNVYLTHCAPRPNRT
jgi:hypothetical protein